MHIVAIGGGNKAPIMDDVLRQLDDPHILINPSACSTEKSYGTKVASLLEFFKERKLVTAVLHEFDKTPSKTRVEHELGRAALVYTIGGNTPHMLQKASEYHLKPSLLQALNSGTIHAGTSAGALLPFKLLHTNPAKKNIEEDWEYTFVDGLGIVDAAAAVHANQHDATPNGTRPDSRLDHFVEHLPADTLGYAIENNAALAINGDEHRIIRSDPSANVYITLNGVAARYAGTIPPF